MPPELVIDATPADDESVVGEECHIISSRGQGPRYDRGVPEERIDDAENLILLCRVHHKMVDDQYETYTAELLRNLKQNHEKWVTSALAEQTQVPPIRVRRVKENVPPFLTRLRSGQELVNIAGGAFGFLFDHEEPLSAAEAEMIADFLQEVQDRAELWDEIGAGERVKASFELTERLHQPKWKDLAEGWGEEVPAPSWQVRKPREHIRPRDSSGPKTGPSE